jgi:PAS domain S-box-containing protein
MKTSPRWHLFWPFRSTVANDRWPGIRGPRRYLRKLRSAISLKARVQLLVGLIILAAIWTLALRAAQVMEEQLTDVLVDSLSMQVANVADDLDRDVQMHKDALIRLASSLTPAILSDPDRLDHALDRFTDFSVVVPSACLVADGRGVILAHYPENGLRNGNRVADQGVFKQVLATGEPALGKVAPLDSVSGGPALAIGVPLRHRGGTVSAVLIGYILLEQPTMLGQLQHMKLDDGSYYLVVSPEDRLILSAPDPGRIMQRMPARGVNPQLDRRLDAGYEGPNFTITAAGAEWLGVGRKMATTGWMVLSGTPTQKIFAPVDDLKHRIYLAALLVSIAAALLLRSMLIRLLAPLAGAAAQMQRMTDGESPLAPIATARSDEVGQLIRNFNRLIIERRRLETSLRSEVVARELANEALRVSNDRLDGIYRSVGDGIVCADTSLRIVLFNEAAERIFGHRAEAVVGQPLGILLPERFRAKHDAHVQDFGATGRASRTMGVYGLVPGLRASGEEFPVEATVSHSGTGSERIYTVIMRDVTERRQAEEERERLLHQLERLNALRATDHEQERGKLAYELHEELGQELVTLRHYIQMMDGVSAKTGVNASRDSALSMAMQATERVRRLVLDLEPRELEDFGLYAAVRGHAERKAAIGKWALQIDAPKPERRIPRDIERSCFQAFRKALDNVLRHAQATEVRIQLRQDDKELELRIHDNGIGFDHDRVVNGIENEGEGLGLLSLRMRVKEFGGAVAIESAPDRGTDVRVTFPLDNSPVVPA